jgi:hypothetical protein
MGGMPALRFFALATLMFVLPAGAFLWHQQLARLEREAVRVLRGPALGLAAGERAVWRLDLDASTEDQAWMDCQRQPRLSVAVPVLPNGLVMPNGSERPRLRARARYLAAGALPEVEAFIDATVDGVREAEPRPDGVVDFGTLWLSYLQPLEIELEVVAWPSGSDLAGFEPAHPVLAGEVSDDYAFARQLDRSIFVAFLCLGVLGVVLFLLAERRRGFVDPRAALVGRG